LQIGAITQFSEVAPNGSAQVVDARRFFIREILHATEKPLSPGAMQNRHLDVERFLAARVRTVFECTVNIIQDRLVIG
jgi:hypothetical protein